MASIQFTDNVTLAANNLTLGVAFDAIKPIATDIGGGGRTITLGGNHALISNHTYEVEVLFRPRGDGSSTPQKCSSIGFITWWNNWNSAYQYIHYSSQAYNERGHFVRTLYRFTASKDVQPDGTALFFIIGNAWANGSDNQNIDVYYYRYQDMTNPSIIDERGINAKIFEIYDSKTDRILFDFLYDENYVNKVLVTGTRNNTPFQDYLMDYVIKPVNYGDISGISSLSYGTQSFTVGQIKNLSIKNVGNLTIEVRGVPTTTKNFSATFYDSYEEYNRVYDIEENPDGEDYVYTKVARQTVSHVCSSSVKIESLLYIYKNNTLMYTISSTESRKLQFDGVVPGDCFYVKNVFKNSGGIVYTKSEYGSYKTMDRLSETSGSIWNSTTSYYYPEDITTYMATQSDIDTSILNGNTDYGYVIVAGNSSRSNSGLGTTGTGLISNDIIITFNSPNNYNEFINILRSQQ